LTSTFQPNATLSSVAQQWAESIARRKVAGLGATNPGGPFDKSGYRSNTIGENIAVDVLATDAVNGWVKQDPASFPWILRPTGTVEFGIGVARGDDGKVYWSIVLAVP
jgi:uncharacterized protein YkwD